MKNKNGFTLIELLAVIVILAIIALIATPIVMNVIEKSKKGASERSAENYISAVETKAATERLDGKLLEGEYIIQSDGNLCPVSGCGLDDVKKLTIDMSGTKPTIGVIKIENGQVLTTSTMKIGEYSIEYDEEKKIYVASIPICKLKEGTALAIGSKYECTVKEGQTQQFYVLDDKGTEVSLIMDRNLGNTVAWCNDESLCKVNGEWNNSAGPITATNYLQEQTSSWKVEASLPTYDQIYKAAGNKETGLPIWLYDYLNGTPNNVDGLSGYWASTPVASYTHIAWGVRSSGIIHHFFVGYDDFYGVRPVITISKTQLG